MDGIHKSNLDFAKQRREKKWDNVFLYCGDEGSGKTTKASQDAYFMDKDFKLDNVAFNKKQILWALDSLPQGSSIQFDEFALEGSAGDLGSVQKILIKKITTIRKRKLTIFFVVSFPWMLKTYFVMRSQSLVRTYSPDNLERGFFRYYSRPRMRKMYFWGLQTNHKWEFLGNYDFHGSFTKTEGLFYDVNKYEKKKDEAIGEIGKASTGIREAKWKERFVRALRFVKENHKYTQEQLGNMFKVERKTIGNLLAPSSRNEPPVGENSLSNLSNKDKFNNREPE